MTTNQTPSQELPPGYDPKITDSKWYRFWEEHHFFKADPYSSKPKFCIAMPPPNVTGVLHMGHALVSTLQDILTRWKRMSGFEALWVPGTDHAGISTQTAVEKFLIKTEKKKRTDHSREDFLKHVWKWKEEHEHRIIEQLKYVGSSCDWSRKRFTMDEGNNQAVKTMFKRLYDQGLIYRGDYLVNWDPVTQTALADDEVEYEERQSSLWYIKYPFKDGSGFVVIATTRPETMLGDTALAISPRDSRADGLLSKTVILPLLHREIPILADHRIDPQFGTGIIKVTPAHDLIDYQIGLEHKLPFINIMTPDGKINNNGQQYAGLSMQEAREAIIKDLKEQGLLVKIEPHVHNVGLSYRSKAVIEPYISKQWFVRMEGFAKKLSEIVRTEKVSLIPKGWENVYFHWIDNLRDWCISRQLWWGHRIPIWYNIQDSSRMICYDGEGIPPEVKANPEEWRQEEDVLDTWFSSALWPFSILGWPKETPELKAFYPNSALITGHDILFFWVARMIMMGDFALQKPPFPQVFLHGLIYGKSYWRTNPDGGITYLDDKERLEYDLGKPLPPNVQSKWEKMSKTKGNVIDPLEIIEQFGTDAMRLALCASSPQTREIDLDRRRFEEFKNFANKIWNGARFVFLNLGGDSPFSAEDFNQGINDKLLSLGDRWILSELNQTIQDVNAHLNGYLFDKAALEAYDFFWNDFCAYYLEIAKPYLSGRLGTAEQKKEKQKLLVIVLSNAIRLLHPVAPFITEELFQHLKKRLDGIKISKHLDPYTEETIHAMLSPACIVSPFPKVIRPQDINQEAKESFNLIEAIVYTIRNIRGEMKLPPGEATDVHIVGSSSDPRYQIIKENTGMISSLVRTKSIQMHTTEPHVGFSCTGFVSEMKIMIPLPPERVTKEKERLTKESERLKGFIEKMRSQLSNQEFLDKAPEALIEKQSESLKQAERDFKEVQHKLSQLES
jgi:valyl-tRNA synthetase